VADPAVGSGGEQRSVDAPRSALGAGDEQQVGSGPSGAERQRVGGDTTRVGGAVEGVGDGRAGKTELVAEQVFHDRPRPAGGISAVVGILADQFGLPKTLSLLVLAALAVAVLGERATASKPADRVPDAPRVVEEAGVA
jgi:hypothetical protein